jgi:murein DD-endopeptidase MepM/ murein hydrolase activator NlpD
VVVFNIMIRRDIVRWQWFVWITAIYALPHLSWAADDATGDLNSALEEMNAIEARIEGLLRETATKQNEIKTLDADARIARELLISGDRTREKGRREIQEIQSSNERDVRALEEAALSGKRQLEQSKSEIRISAPILVHAARTRGVEPGSLGLALIHLRQKQQANLAVEQVLKVEELKAARLTRREKIEEFSQKYAAFAGMKLEDLRKRHRDLSRQMERLTAAAASNESAVGQLSERRQALNEFIARLSAGEPVPKEIAAVAAAPSPVGAKAAPSLINEGERPEIENEEQSELALGTRVGNGAATVRLDLEGDDGGAVVPTNGDPNRHWRASATIVHAIAPGTVLFGGTFAGYRHLLVIDHGGGWVSVYGNLTRCDLIEGHKVETGQLLGEYHPETMTKPEPFWLEVRHNAKPVPVETMPAAGQGWEDRVYGGSKV